MSKAHKMSSSRSLGGKPDPAKSSAEPDLQDQMGNSQIKDLLNQGSNSQELRLPA